MPASFDQSSGLRLNSVDTLSHFTLNLVGQMQKSYECNLICDAVCFVCTKKNDACFGVVSLRISRTMLTRL